MPVDLRDFIERERENTERKNIPRRKDNDRIGLEKEAEREGGKKECP